MNGRRYLLNLIGSTLASSLGANRAPSMAPIIRLIPIDQLTLPPDRWNNNPTQVVPARTYEEVAAALTISRLSSSNQAKMGPPPLSPATPTINPLITPNIDAFRESLVDFLFELALGKMS